MDRHRGRRRLLGLMAAALACGGLAGAEPARAAVEPVDQVGNSFRPQQVEIAVNDRVVWTNRSNTSHTVTFDNGPDLHPTCDPDTTSLLRVGCQTPGATREHTFSAPGTYPYYCKIHGGRGGRGMAGVVVVTASAAAPTTTPTVASTTATTVRASTTTTTRATTSSSTTTTRPLATSSALAASSSTSTTPDTSSVLLPGDPPPFAGDDVNSSAAGRSGGTDNGSDTTTVVLIVALLLAVSAGGGYLLWRLRPGRI